MPRVICTSPIADVDIVATGASGDLAYRVAYERRSTDTFDILDNGLGKNPTVTLSASEWFETSDCGD